MNYIHTYISPLGKIILASDGENLVGLWFENQKYFADILSSSPKETNLPVFEKTIEWLDIYFDSKIPNFAPQILMRTTSFRKEVWKKLLTIPYGKTTTYGEIASRIAKDMGSKKDVCSSSWWGSFA